MIKQVSYAGTLPISLTEAQNFLKVPSSNTADNSLITLLIQAAVQHAENVTSLSLASKNYILYLDRFPGFPFTDAAYAPLFGALPFYFGFSPSPTFPPMGDFGGHNLPFVINIDIVPVTAVGNITYIGLDGNPASLVPGQDFLVDLGSEPARLAPLPGSRWPLAMAGLSNIQIPFTAGFTATVDTDIVDETISAAPNPPDQTTAFDFVISVPADLKMAMLMLIADAYANREPNVAGAVGRISTVTDVLMANRIWDYSQQNR